MANFNYYTQNSLAELGTLATTTGAASNLTNILNYQWQSIMTITTVTASQYGFSIDLGSTLKAAGWLIINHNLYTQGSCDIEVWYGAADSGAFDTLYNTYSVTSSDEPIFIFLASGSITKRYWKFEIQNAPIANTSYLANFFFMGDADFFQPTTDPSLPRDRGWIRDGLIINQSNSGSKFAVEMQDRRRVWGILYEHISTANKTILEDLEEACGGGLKPFVFTDDGGTTYFYVRWDENSPLSCRELASGLWECSFRLIEEI